MLVLRELESAGVSTMSKVSSGEVSLNYLKTNGNLKETFESFYI